MSLDDCPLAVKVYSILLIIICILMLLSTFPIIYQFLVKHKKEAQTKAESTRVKNTNRLLYAGAVFIASTVLALLSDIGVHVLICHPNQTIQYIFSSFYIIQFYFLLVLLFMRVKFVFNGTPFGLSPLTIRIYRIFYIFMPITLITAVAMYNINTLVFVSFAMIGVLMIMILVISIIILFVYKLINVYKFDSNSKAEDDQLIHVITKNTILTFISLSMTFLQIIAIIIQSFAPDAIGVDPTWITTLIDIYTNFLCMLLTYNEFTNYYYKLCKCCDNKCKLICHKMIIGDKDAKMIQAELNTLNVQASTPSNMVID